MKKTRVKLIVAMLAISWMSAFASPTPSNWRKVPIKGEKPIRDNSPAHKSQQKIRFPEVYYDTPQNCLYIASSSTLNGAYYYIENEEGEIILSGALAFPENTYYEIELPVISYGCHTLVIEVGELKFEGNVVVE